MADQAQIDKDKALIDQLGGPSKVAELLGYDADGGVQRVQNWKARGIPPAVKVQRPDIFLALSRRRANRSAKAEQGAAHG